MTVEFRNNGVLDIHDNGGRVFNKGTGQWSNYTSWDTWNSWVASPSEYLYHLLEAPTDFGQVKTVNILTDIRARGLVHYYIHYTTGSDFTTSSVLHITPGQTNIPSITARQIYMEVAIQLDAPRGHQYFDGINYRISDASEQVTTIAFSGIDSSTLPGTSADRTYTPSIDVGTIKSVKITPRTAPSYDVDMYVYHSSTSTRVFPQVISTGQDVHLTFTGVDGRPRDCTFDIELSINPEWYMDANGNLRER